jgi:hypothetical protein
MSSVAIWTTLLFWTHRAIAANDACDQYGDPVFGSPLAEADQIATGSDAYAYSGRSLAFIGDFDGDGRQDAAIGMPGDGANGVNAGAVDLFLTGGSPLDIRHGPTVRLYGSGAFDNAGWSVSGAGDVNGDGFSDLLIGARPSTGANLRPGVAWLVLGRFQTPTHINLATGADATFRDPRRADTFGSVVQGVGDLNGDGFDDIAIGAPSATANGAQAGAAFLFQGPLAGDYGIGDAFAVIAGEEAGDNLGAAIASVGDADGDGTPDLLIGAPGAGPNLAADGAAYLISGADIQHAVYPAQELGQRISGSTAERFGGAVSAAGDVNHDGLADLWVGAAQALQARRGAAYLIYGSPIVPGADLRAAQVWEARVRGAAVLDSVGGSVDGGHDFNGDGEPDVIIGATLADGEVVDSGSAFVLAGPLDGDRQITEDGRFGGESASGRAGFAVAGAADINGDGFDDWMISSPWSPVPGAARAGVTALFYGGADRTDATLWHADADHDTWGSVAATVWSCEAPEGFIARGGDCNDASSAYRPFAIERDCEDVHDYNCDGSVGRVDRDADGVMSCEGDCSDILADVSPAKPERCFNDIDDDCNAVIDDNGAIDATVWYPDSDGDGYGSQNISFRACNPPDFFLAPPVTTGLDCDDLWADSHPGVSEVCDQHDNDCDGETDEDALDALDFFRDADRDGSGKLADRLHGCALPEGYVENYDDCDDTVQAVRPGRPEVCDFIDDDCDGMFYRGGHLPVSEATWRMDGAEPGYRLGAAIASVPDTDGDGDDELAVASAGDIRGSVIYVGAGDLVSGSYDLEKDWGNGVRGWDLRVTTPRYNDEVGKALAGGDFDGDGIGDLAISAPSANYGELVDAGAVYVFYGPFHHRDTRPELADAVIWGSHGQDRAGDVMTAGDIDGDGDDELFISAIGLDDPSDLSNGNPTEAESKRGGVYMLLGGPDRSAWQGNELDTEAHVLGLTARAELGRSMKFIGDTDHNGMGELIVGAPRTGYQRWYGAALIVEPEPGQATGVLSPIAVLADDRLNSQLGYQVGAGDINGDGTTDLVLTNAQSDVWVVYGDGAAWSSGIISNQSVTRFTGPINQELGNALDVFDANQDGLDDMVMGAPEDDEGGVHAGAVYIIYGRADLPEVVLIEDVESFGRVTYGTRAPVFSFVNNCYLEGAKLLGPGDNAMFGYNLIVGFKSGVSEAGDVVAGAPGFRDNLGAVTAWSTGRYGTDWKKDENAELTESKSVWWPDRNLDGMPDVSQEPERSCAMHIPVPCEEPRTGPGCTAEDDSDVDGVPDCRDMEVCDGLDNNGDGAVDEGYDTDKDGIADCVDTETCDGVDNDGDTRIDEGFDADADGTADCFDPEACDGVDNDGDGRIDEGFDADGDRVADCYDSEVCDGRDNDGDGAADEGFDADFDGVSDCFDTETCDNIDNDGDGRIDEGLDADADGLSDCFDVETCDGRDNDGDRHIDEGFDADLDGRADCFDREECDGLDNDGDRLVDEGFDADRDGVPDCVDVETCDGVDNNANGMIDEGFDVDQDRIPDCLDTEACDGQDNDGDGNVDEGFDADADGLADCFDVEVCDGVDNDGDRQIDEGFDVDRDLTADCFDAEVCDGQDNDGDGQIDEGFDNDSDGTADCFDTETCDGVDNDGDGRTDEGFDVDADGVADCFDPETCDGRDNDGDAAVDEGFDVDADGVADCQDAETCDGVDNDGDGQIDEGFDYDADGTANCFDTETCDSMDNDGDGRVDEGFDADFDGIAACYDTEVCDALDNDGDGATDEGFDADADGLPDCFDTEVCDGRDNDGDGATDEGFDADRDGRADCFDTEGCDGRPSRGVPDADSDGILDCFDTEVCDGVDNDGDRAVDEGYDVDADGIADCFDVEECDSVDNDGDRAIDEGFANADFDNLADCVDPETCDGLDNDGDGEVDEFYPDADRNGVADCVGTETCDGLDNDANGQIDEGYSDVDHDGRADCVDFETCDGLDNNGNGHVDEGFDADADGTANCFDTETCDGVDNDGDYVIDEGFDVDADGLPDCYDAEQCDGRDNDGDLAVDEGFDADHDGTADCYDVEVCDGQDNDGDGQTDEGFDNDVDGIPNCADTESCDGLDNDGDGAIDEGFDNDNNGIANCFDIEWCDGVDNDGDGATDEGFDADNDGLANCFDAEVCDGLDNDGDNATDEGFDFDNDGLANCFDTEVCDALDNDGDGSTDEGFDADFDGVANCFDVEACDLLDNDGDGLTDEGFDADRDGLADCVDTEVCDGQDNDGDRVVDEGFDADRDGVADCFDMEVCDGLDNDGDLATDEGFDTDTDGIANCFDVEQCDGKDNDGDTFTDEGFDADRDGLADCYDVEVCDGLDNDGDGFSDEGFDSDGDGLGNCLDTEECDGVDNDGDRLIDEGFDSDRDGVANCFDFEVCDGVDNDGDGLVDEGAGDSDRDGICDEVDEELCDGIDNDGDALIDEDYACPDPNGLCHDVTTRTSLTWYEARSLGWVSYTTSATSGAIMVARNNGSMPVTFTEQLLLSSTESQSNITDFNNVGVTLAPGGSYQMYYGSYTTNNPVQHPYLNQPAWWCTELGRATATGKVYNMFGEKAPTVLMDLVAPGLASRTTWGGTHGVQSNYDIWNYLAAHTLLTVGKVAQKNVAAGTATINLAVRDMGAITGTGTITDVIPAGWHLTAVPPGWTALPQGDGTTRITRTATLMGGVGNKLGAPTMFAYTIAPDVTTDKSYVDLDRASITFVDGGQNRVEQSQPATLFSIDSDRNGYIECK